MLRQVFRIEFNPLQDIWCNMHVTYVMYYLAVIKCIKFNLIAYTTWHCGRELTKVVDTKYFIHFAHMYDDIYGQKNKGFSVVK